MTKTAKRMTRRRAATSVAVVSAVLIAVFAAILDHDSHTGGSTRVAVVGSVALTSRAGGKHILLIAQNDQLEAMALTPPFTKEAVDLTLPPLLRGPGVLRAAIINHDALTAIPGDGTAFVTYAVIGRRAERSYYEVVAVSLRTGQESVFARGGNAVLGATGRYIAWQTESRHAFSRLANTVVVENLHTRARRYVPLAGAISSSVELAWSSDGRRLAISYETASGTTEQRIELVHVSIEGFHLRTRLLRPIRNYVGDVVSASSWLNANELLLAGSDPCLIVSVWKCSRLRREMTVGPVLALLNVMSGSVAHPSANGLFAITDIARDPVTRLTVIVGAPRGARDSSVLERRGMKPLLRYLWPPSVAWISAGALEG